MDTWEGTIGNNKQLQSKAVYDKLGQAFYLYMLACRAKKHEAALANDDDYTTYDENDPESFPKDPYFQFETFAQALDPKKPKKKTTKKKKDDEDEEAPEEEEPQEEEGAEPAYYTYTHAEYKLVKDEDTKKTAKDADGNAVKEVVLGPKKVKKFTTIGVDMKRYLAYLLNKFMKEAHDCFLSKGKKFAKNVPVLDQVNEYVHANFDQDGLAPFLIAASKLVPVDNFIDEGDLKGSSLNLDVAKFLSAKVVTGFKGDTNQKPVAEVDALVETFLNFVKCIAVLFVEYIWGKPPGPVHIAQVDSIVRQMYVLLNSDEKGGHTYQFEIYTTAASWVSETVEKETKQREAAKEEKAASGTSTKGKGTGKGKGATKGKGAGKGKKKAADDDADADGDAGDAEEGGDEVDNQVDELANEDGDGDADAVDYDN